MRRSTALGVALLGLLVIAHFAYGHLAHWLHPGSERAVRALHSVLTGASEAGAYLGLLLLSRGSPMLALAGTFGALCGLAKGLCRISAAPLNQPVPEGANAGGLCDVATGLPLTGGVALALLVALLLIDLRRVRHG